MAEALERQSSIPAQFTDFGVVLAGNGSILVGGRRDLAPAAFGKRNGA
jgi:hypothetical protein